MEACTRKRLRSVWSKMIRRCHCADDAGYPRYGGRGIAVCDEWRDSFEAFYSWVVANGWGEGLEIDRRDNNGHYSPENCRFVTPTQNQQNKGKIRVRQCTSRFKGVVRDKRGWRASIKINDRQVRLGTFESEECAALAYDSAARQHFGEYANLNFPEADPLPLSDKLLVRRMRGWEAQAGRRKEQSGRQCSSRFKGVYVRPKTSAGGRIAARIVVHGRKINLGYFRTEEDAARAYDAAALEHFGEFARLNFPQDALSQTA